MRHGESNYNIKGLLNSDPKKLVYLTKRGKKQAEDIVKQLKNEDIEIIFTSEFLRAKQTANVINKSLNIPIKIDKRINERKTGFEGKLESDFQRLIEKDKFNLKPKGGESFQEEKNRVFSFLEYLKKTKYENVLIISHGEPIMICAGYFKKLSNEEILNVKIDNCELIKFEI